MKIWWAEWRWDLSRMWRYSMWLLCCYSLSSIQVLCVCWSWTTWNRTRSFTTSFIFPLSFLLCSYWCLHCLCLCLIIWEIRNRLLLNGMGLLLWLLKLLSPCIWTQETFDTLVLTPSYSWTVLTIFTDNISVLIGDILWSLRSPHTPSSFSLSCSE